jgi:hypothetical protein
VNLVLELVFSIYFVSKNKIKIKCECKKRDRIEEIMRPA